MSATILPIQACAMTLQGNASNGLQQDAFFFIDDWHQEKLGITPLVSVDDVFCVAISDGVAESPLSQYVSIAVVKAVKREWQNYIDSADHLKPIMSIAAIYEAIANAPVKYKGASATLALLYRLRNLPNQVFIKHIGDSRVYLQRNGKWHALTRDHNVLNQLIDEKAEAEDRRTDFSEYNRDGMARSLYALTEVLTVDSDEVSNPMPSYDSQILTVQQGDCFVVCTDGVHDLVPCNAWQFIDKDSDLQSWLKNLSKQIYSSQGRAYDNATAIVIRFDENCGLTL